MKDFDRLTEKIQEVEIERIEPEELAEPQHKTLRLATLDDVPALLELGKDLYKDSPLEFMKFDFSKVRENLEAAILNPKEWLVLVSHDEGKPVGCLVAYVFNPLYSKEKIACEVLWHLLPEHRKGRRGVDMMVAFEYWAKLMGCAVAQYGWMTSSPARMEELYEKRGLKMVEKVYFKELD